MPSSLSGVIMNTKSVTDRYKIMLSEQLFFQGRAVERCEKTKEDLDQTV